MIEYKATGAAFSVLSPVLLQPSGILVFDKVLWGP